MLPSRSNHVKDREVKVGQRWRHEQHGEFTIADIDIAGVVTLVARRDDYDIKATAGADRMAISSKWERIA